MRPTLKWGQREQLSVTPDRSGYYTTTSYRVPVTAPVTDAAGAERIRSALYARWANNLTGWSVGGYVTPNVRLDSDPLHVIVEQVYHHGD